MIVVDASFLLRLLIDGAETDAAESLWRTWRHERRPVLAPSLLFYEITNVLHRYLRHGHLEAPEARGLVAIAEAFRIERIDDSNLHERALTLASELDLPAAYDVHYLALAEQRQAELWTSDRKLVRATRHRFPWVHLLEAETRGKG